MQITTVAVSRSTSAPFAAGILTQITGTSGWDGISQEDAIWLKNPIVCLSATAMTTSQISLGTVVVPTSLRKPLKLASESAALGYLWMCALFSA